MAKKIENNLKTIKVQKTHLELIAKKERMISMMTSEKKANLNSKNTEMMILIWKNT
tara:strand:+ start:239 stop:406 length:168 start_codon:yes stop_codon:yes gene_type:complete